MFKPTTAERFREMLEIFPHAHQDAKGFLGGKPSDHLRCTVTGEVRATYPAFIEHQGRYYESTVGITVPEYEDFDPRGLP